MLSPSFVILSVAKNLAATTLRVNSVKNLVVMLRINSAKNLVVILGITSVKETIQANTL